MCSRKQKHLPFPSIGEIRSKKKLQLVHSDVCGPMSVSSFGGAKYFVTFIDDFSRCVVIYPMAKKSETFSKFMEYEAAATNEAGVGIKTLRTDNGGEFTSK